MEKVIEIVSIANLLLPEEDAEIVKDFYDNNEFGLAVTQAVDRLHDLDIKIDTSTINKISSICKNLKLDPSEWEFIRDLEINEKNHNSYIELDSLGVDASQVYNDLIAGDMPPKECARTLQENGVSELIATRILRQKYGMSFDEAIAQISQNKFS